MIEADVASSAVRCWMANTADRPGVGPLSSEMGRAGDMPMLERVV